MDNSFKVISKSLNDTEIIAEKLSLFFKENGLPGERFSDTINRIGFSKVEAEILNDDILQRKDEILNK